MQNFDNFRELEVSNANLSFRNDQMSRELNRLILEVKEKNEQIGALNDKLRRQRESQLSVNKENIKLKV